MKTPSVKETRRAGSPRFGSATASAGSGAGHRSAPRTISFTTLTRREAAAEKRC